MVVALSLCGDGETQFVQLLRCLIFALRKAIQTAYRLDHLPVQQEVLAIAEKWRPYRSLATSYLFSAAFDPAR